MTTIGELIDKLTIVNIKIWDATEKAHFFDQKKDKKKAYEYLTNLEMMNVQRKKIIDEINLFFNEKKDMLNVKTYGNK